MLVVLLLTQSRGGIIAGAVALIVLLGLKDRRVLATLAVGAAALSVWLVLWMGPARLFDVVSATASISNLASREEVWSRAVYK